VLLKHARIAAEKHNNLSEDLDIRHASVSNV